MPAIRTARERARAELTHEIKEEARRQLAAQGAAALSLRAVARELGMASSALYRYFPSRDELLTALIIDAYDAVGADTERADAAHSREETRARWFTFCRTVRRWAIAHPQEYALVYGSPVPGYRAPRTTVGPATRVMAVLAAVIHDAREHGSLEVRTGDPDLFPAVAADARRIADDLMPGVPVGAVTRVVIAWTQLFGLVSFELFGHLVGGVEDTAAFFEQSIGIMASFVGLT